MQTTDRNAGATQLPRRLRWLDPLIRQVAFREWCIMGAFLIALTAALASQNGLGRLDQTLYDHFSTQLSRPARDDIVIVGIDDYSLAELGRWPWAREKHADLVRQLSKAGARAIGLDIILSEPDPAGAGDTALAGALKSSGRAVLPVVIGGTLTEPQADVPIAPLAAAAGRLGHISLNHDSDGVVRHVTLRRSGSGQVWPQFALAVFEAGAAGDAATPSTGRERLYIAFAGNAGHFRSVPYVAALRGEVPADFFAGKHVLVGATAPGMTDSYPTPVSGGSGSMPGVEIHANILAGLLEDKFMSAAAPWQNILFCVVPLLIALFCYLLFRPRNAVIVSGLLFIITLAASYEVMKHGLWLPPSAALIALIISYPLWSWRRLEAAISYLGQEFSRLENEPHLLPEVLPKRAQDRIEDILEHRIRDMKRAARRVRDLRRFVSDSLDNLPDATLVTDDSGRVLLTNHAAQLYFNAGNESLTNRQMPHLLARLKSPSPLAAEPVNDFVWTDLLDAAKAQALVAGVGASDDQGRDLLVKSAPVRSAANQHAGWIISVIDISTIRAAERSRDETLRFLSHDMRAPQASILALLELQHTSDAPLPERELFSRIEKAARRTLGLADNFVQLARAESHEYRVEEVDFHDVVLDAIDEMWSLSKNKRIALQSDIGDGEFMVRVDRALITRALVNLISNAINYSPENTSVVCHLEREETEHGTQIVCRVSDQGYGIAEADQTKLFQRFERVSHADQPRHEGVGLGLVFVKTVVEKHRGHIHFISAEGKGTTFIITLPASAADDEATENSENSGNFSG
ncbi:MAG: two-component sensor histidine kinase [Paucimonas sp.]|nr:two-component sensor histidine kinase [Paucimonas sp.]